MRRHLLLILSFWVALPMFVVFALSGIALMRQKQAVESLAATYAGNLAESIAASWKDNQADLQNGSGGRGHAVGPGTESPPRGEPPRPPEIFPGGESLVPPPESHSSAPLRMREMMERRRQERLFIEGPPVPGWVALATTEGRFLRGSPGAAEAFPAVAEHLRSLPKDQVAPSAPTRIRSASRERFTVAFASPEDGRFVIVVAVSVPRMLGPLGHQGTLWAVLVLAMAALGLVAVWFQWRWLVLPLRRQAGQVKELRWGEERLAPPRGFLVEEMHDLGEALSLLSGAAVEKEELQHRYVGDILAAQEEERSRIARDLHDGPLQIVSSLIQRVQLARLAGSARKAEVPLGNDAPAAGAREEHLALAEDAAGFALAELRGICDALSPPWIDLGLLQAMEELGNRLARSFGVTVTVTVTGEGVPDCSRDRVLALFRIFQEGAANAVRHGGATHLRLHLSSVGDGVRFELRDDGSGVPGGLDPEKLRAAGHRGVVGMMERVAFFGGTFSLAAAPEGGSVLQVLLPGGDGGRT